MSDFRRAKVIYFIEKDAYQAVYGGMTKDLQDAQLYDIDEVDEAILYRFSWWQPNICIKVVKVTVELE